MFNQLNYEEENKINMAYWLPLLMQYQLPVPKTIMVHTGGCDVQKLIEKKSTPAVSMFIKRLITAIEEIGTPCFLRTGMTSNKHDWKDSCYLDKSDANTVIDHVCNLIEASYSAYLAGAPSDFSFFAVRKLIPTKTILTAFNGMPITKERRVFIRDGKVQCNHPYWPKEALENVTEEQLELLHYYEEEDSVIIDMANFIGRHLKGYWSIDFLKDIHGNWWIIDMATGDRSYHYPGCTAKDVRITYLKET